MKRGMIVIIGLGLVLWMASAQAAMKDMKIYKEAFPDAKIKCINCHVDTMPKKDDGKHELNAYGKAAMVESKKAGAAADASPTADMYKKIGKVEDFKK